MRIPFVKMHGLGNDFVIFDDIDGLTLTPEILQKIAHRQLGVGFDQLIVLKKSAAADVRMDIYNSDGSMAGACGNATRCIGHLVGQRLGLKWVSIDTDGGLLKAQNISANFVRVNMGQPEFGWREIPLASDTTSFDLDFPAIGLMDGFALSIGNPHVVFFGKDWSDEQVQTLGPKIENDPIFPNKVNVSFAKIMDDKTIELKTWERGAGYTLACGTGACATAVAAISKKLTGRKVDVQMRSGSVTIEWDDKNDVWMSGPVAKAFQGELDLEDYN